MHLQKSNTTISYCFPLTPGPGLRRKHFEGTYEILDEQIKASHQIKIKQTKGNMHQRESTLIWD